MRPGRDGIFLGLLTAATAALAAALWLAGSASALEAVAFVTGAACVWLTVKENVWNFPVGLVNVAAFVVVFYEAGLLADAGLQVVYFALGVGGWYLWLRGGERHTPLRIARATPAELAVVAAAAVALTVPLWQALQHFGGSASFFDALTTSLSLCAQWLLNRKRVQNWYYWIAVDVIYIPLYLYKGLYLTAVLYAVFLCMATVGLLRWRATWREQQATARGFPVVFPAAAASAAAAGPAVATTARAADAAPTGAPP